MHWIPLKLEFMFEFFGGISHSSSFFAPRPIILIRKSNKENTDLTVWIIEGWNEDAADEENGDETNENNDDNEDEDVTHAKPNTPYDTPETERRICSIP